MEEEAERPEESSANPADFVAMVSQARNLIDVLPPEKVTTTVLSAMRSR